MPLSPGTRLGAYVIEDALGAGGMGEVYRARDTNLGREVAIKILPAALALDAERVARFRREAQVLASLNHPHIAQIYGFEEANGVQFLSMELVDGETLDKRIARGPLSWSDSIAIARQIEGALEAAHERGIIHRDLKPANIKVKPDGSVKVLDFGLAKSTEQPATAGSGVDSLTIAVPASMVGQIIGTAAYMAPEQASGQSVDKRVDIWAFGVVLHEMLTGRRLFDGATISETLAHVLTREPQWDRVPVNAQRLLKSCLEKDPRRRLRDIGDAWRLLEDGRDHRTSDAGLWRIVAAVLAVLCAAAFWAPWRSSERPIDMPSTHVDLDLGPEVSFGSTTGPAVILSPDGTRMVFVSQDVNGNRHLLTRRLDQTKAVELPGTDGAFAQFFSPDGQWVGFFAHGKLKKTRLDGGEPVFLCDAPGGRGASWGDDGNIVATLDQQSGLSVIRAEGGRVETITNLDVAKGETTHRWPYVLPGSRAALFFSSVAYGHYDEADIEAVTLKDHRIKLVLPHAGMYPRYLPTGHLLYLSNGTAFVAPFDLQRLEVTGTAVPLWEIGANPNLGYAQLDFSGHGVAAYRTAGVETLRTIEWLDERGTSESLGLEPAYYMMSRLSPDGRRVAYTRSQGSSQEIWTYDLVRAIKTRLTGGQNAYPAWTPDGRFLVFQSLGGVSWTRADGSTQPQPLTRSKTVQLPFSFSPDGGRLAISEYTPGAESDIRIVAIDDRSGQLHAGVSEVFSKTVVGLTYPAFSPDGHWIAYDNAVGGQYEVYVRAFPDNGTQVQVSNAGGICPIWSRNQHQLFYRTEDQRIMVVNYAVKGVSFEAEKPRVWSSKPLANTGLAINFDVAPDGKRVIAVVPAERTESHESQSHVMLVTNFFDEVRRRVSTR